MRIKSQLYSDAEAQKKVGAVLDDCGPSSAAAAVAYVNGYRPDLQASDGVAAKARGPAKLSGSVTNTRRTDRASRNDLGGDMIEALGKVGGRRTRE